MDGREEGEEKGKEGEEKGGPETEMRPVSAGNLIDCPKFYMADTGILMAMMDDEARADVLVRRNLGTWKGGFFENVVAEALVKAGAEPVYSRVQLSSAIPALARGVGK